VPSLGPSVHSKYPRSGDAGTVAWSRAVAHGGVPMPSRYVDADGHVLENLREVSEFLEDSFAGARAEALLPSLDRFHTPRAVQFRIPGTFDRSIGPERWIEFLDKTGLEYSVLYPTDGLAFGQIAFA